MLKIDHPNTDVGVLNSAFVSLSSTIRDPKGERVHPRYHFEVLMRADRSRMKGGWEVAQSPILTTTLCMDNLRIIRG